MFSGAAEAEHLNILSVLEDSGREAVVMWLRLLLEGESRGHDDTDGFRPEEPKVMVSV